MAWKSKDEAKELSESFYAQAGVMKRVLRGAAHRDAVIKRGRCGDA